MTKQDAPAVHSKSVIVLQWLIVILICFSMLVFFMPSMVTHAVKHQDWMDLGLYAVIVLPMMAAMATRFVNYYRYLAQVLKHADAMSAKE